MDPCRIPICHLLWPTRTQNAGLTIDGFIDLRKISSAAETLGSHAMRNALYRGGCIVCTAPSQDSGLQGSCMAFHAIYHCCGGSTQDSVWRSCALAARSMHDAHARIVCGALAACSIAPTPRLRCVLRSLIYWVLSTCMHGHRHRGEKGCYIYKTYI